MTFQSLMPKPISFYSICKFIGAWHDGNINQHGQWLESCISNGLDFHEMKQMLNSLNDNNSDDNMAIYNIDQIRQVLVIVEVMSLRFKVYMVTSYQVEQFKENGIPANTPYIDSDGQITYTSDKRQEV